MKDFIKSTEAICVYVGLFLAFTLGKFWIIATAAAYTLVNVPNAWNKIKAYYKKLRNE